MTDTPPVILTDDGVFELERVELEGARLAARLADSYAQRGRASVIALEALDRVGPDLAPLVLFNALIRYATEVVPTIIHTANDLAAETGGPHVGEQYIDQAAAHVTRIDHFIKENA